MTKAQDVAENLSPIDTKYACRGPYVATQSLGATNNTRITDASSILSSTQKPNSLREVGLDITFMILSFMTEEGLLRLLQISKHFTPLAQLVYHARMNEYLVDLCRNPAELRKRLAKSYQKFVCQENDALDADDMNVDLDQDWFAIGNSGDDFDHEALVKDAPYYRFFDFDDWPERYDWETYKHEWCEEDEYYNARYDYLYAANEWSEDDDSVEEDLDDDILDKEEIDTDMEWYEQDDYYDTKPVEDIEPFGFITGSELLTLVVSSVSSNPTMNDDSTDEHKNLLRDVGLDITFMIFSFMTGEGLIQLAQVSKRFEPLVQLVYHARMNEYLPQLCADPKELRKRIIKSYRKRNNYDETKSDEDWFFMKNSGDNEYSDHEYNPNSKYSFYYDPEFYDCTFQGFDNEFTEQDDCYNNKLDTAEILQEWAGDDQMLEDNVDYELQDKEAMDEEEEWYSQVDDTYCYSSENTACTTGPIQFLTGSQLLAQNK
jgi:hypothetical protein